MQLPQWPSEDPRIPALFKASAAPTRHNLAVFNRACFFFFSKLVTGRPQLFEGFVVLLTCRGRDGDRPDPAYATERWAGQARIGGDTTHEALRFRRDGRTPRARGAIGRLQIQRHQVQRRAPGLRPQQSEQTGGSRPIRTSRVAAEIIRHVARTKATTTQTVSRSACNSLGRSRLVLE